MASQTVIEIKRSRLAEDRELLAQVKEAISAILTGAQSYTIGSRNLNAHFYYLREQAELNGRMYQQALDDIDKAISLEADAPLYHLERAALMLRVGENEEALRSAQQAQKLSPDNADAYLLAGIALGELGQKAQALEALNSAKAKGSTDAEAYIGQYSK